MAMRWGKFKDLVDELVYEIGHKQNTWGEFRDDLNEQITASNTAKGEHMTALAEATGNINADTSGRGRRTHSVTSSLRSSRRR